MAQDNAINDQKPQQEEKKEQTENNKRDAHVPQTNKPKPDELRQELEISRKKTQEYLEGWQRARADYSNLKKETDKKMQEIAVFANVSLLFEIIPIFDHYYKALQHVPKDHQEKDWMKSFSHIYSQFLTFAKSIGLEKIETVGKKFDPNLHEAVLHEENKNYASDVIIEEVQTGWKLRGEVIIPAKVKVAK